MLDEHTAPSSPFGVFEVPGGYIGEVTTGEGDEEVTEKKLFNIFHLKEMTGHEEDILANEQISITERFHKIIGRCIEKVETEDGRHSIIDSQLLQNLPNDLLLSDNIVLILRIRQITVGKTYTFTIRCPECRVAQTKGFDLSNIEVYSVEGNPLERIRRLKLRNGHEVVWEMMSGRDEKEEANESKVKVTRKSRRGGNQKNKDRSRATKALMIRLRTVNGKPVNMKEIKDMSFNDREDIRSEFDKEGGIETDFDITCSNCGIEFISELQIGGASFFSRSEDE